MDTDSDRNPEPRELRIALISLLGLIRAREPELGRDADTGGQIKYVLELAEALSQLDEVKNIDLITRQIIDDRVGTDYAQVEESICDKAKIVRIPFGPRRYQYKERLWPYLDGFVDQAIKYFRRSGGTPDIIHGHYADAGYAGAQLSRLLGPPFVFTGHSLGRVKRQRLSQKKDANPKKLEEKYHFTTRIEAEELALETALLVIAITFQEVEDQYQLYDHYVPGRMEVVPPGVDLKQFYPLDTTHPRPKCAGLLDRFLSDPNKPMIMAIARPDERNKNTIQFINDYFRVRFDQIEIFTESLVSFALKRGTSGGLSEIYLSVSVCVANPGNPVTNCPRSLPTMAANPGKPSHEIIQYPPQKRNEWE